MIVKNIIQNAMATLDNLPILYSFRRCPYAMRARMAITKADIKVELREVVLRDKPQAMLDASSKGTVPTLVLPDNIVIDESIDIMRWALSQNDPENWLTEIEETKALISENDGPFKKALDRFKYPSRYPDEDCSGAQGEVQAFFKKLNDKLQKTSYLSGDTITITDIALFPFIRQASKVEPDWFESLSYKNLYRWLNEHLDSALFKSIMKKYNPWQDGDGIIIFPPQ